VINVRRGVDELQEQGSLPSGARERFEASLQKLLRMAHQKEGVTEQDWVRMEAEFKDAANGLKSKTEEFARRTNMDVAVNNLYLTLWRMAHRRHLHEQPLPANLDVKVTKIGPRKLRIEGTINVLDLARMHIIFRDKNWRELDSLPDEQRMERLTMEWDYPSIRGGQFKWELNLNRDPADMERDPRTIYPLTSDEYEVVVMFNPRSQAPFIQDVYGWSGEGITDPRYLTTDDSRAGVVEGKRVPLRLIQKRVILKRSEVL
jgi:hypothetical protein